MDRFQEARKEVLVNKFAAMNYDPFEVKDLLESKGIWENTD